MALHIIWKWHTSDGCLYRIIPVLICNPKRLSHTQKSTLYFAGSVRRTSISVCVCLIASKPRSMRPFEYIYILWACDAPDDSIKNTFRFPYLEAFCCWDKCCGKLAHTLSEWRTTFCCVATIIIGIHNKQDVTYASLSLPLPLASHMPLSAAVCHSDTFLFNFYALLRFISCVYRCSPLLLLFL